MLTPDDAWLRPGPTGRQARNDVLLGLGLTVVSVLTVELLAATPGGAAIDRHGEALLWSVVCVLPLVVRRRFPVTVMLVCSLTFYGAGERIPTVLSSAVLQVALFVAIYTAWAWARRRRALLAWSVVVVVGMFAWLVQIIVTTDLPPGTVPSGRVSPAVAVAVLTIGLNLVYFGGAIAWGSAAHRSARQREQLEQQAEELRRERDLSARRAVVDERLRIARDLHDVVAHHVTGIGVQAAAAGHVLSRDPAGSRQALSAIEESSRTAVREMHQLVGLLRDDPDDPGSGSSSSPPSALSPGSGRQPSLSAVRDLVGSGADGGLEVSYREVGDPFPVPAAVGTSAYRTVQEALTNVTRHSTARRAEVVLRYLGEAGAVEVEVLDAGAPRPVHVAGSGSGSGAGYGLTGIRERAGMHGGLCEIGPRPDGGFRVRVRLPVDGTPR